MTNIKYIFIIIIISFPITGYSQNLQPLDIAKLYLNYSGFPDKEKYYCCEFNDNKSDDSTFGMFFPENITREYELILQTEDMAVISSTIYDSLNVFDTYLYFRNQNGWKLEAQRSLAYDGIALGFIEKYEKLTPEERKKMADSSMQEWDLFYKIAKLQIKPDKEIIKHFINEKSKYENMLKIVISYNDIDKDEFWNFQKTDSTLNSLKNDALISQIYKFNYSPIGKTTLNNCYFFMILGVLDNTVGYLFCKDKFNLPEISKEGFIIIKEIGNGWYLYKTT